MRAQACISAHKKPGEFPGDGDHRDAGEVLAPL
jgi:hypothetical protein